MKSGTNPTAFAGQAKDFSNLDKAGEGPGSVGSPGGDHFASLDGQNYASEGVDVNRLMQHNLKAQATAHYGKGKK